MQALLEMSDVQSAQAMVNYYSERPPNVRGRTIYVQFSNHVELKTEQSSQVRPAHLRHCSGHVVIYNVHRVQANHCCTTFRLLTL